MDRSGNRLIIETAREADDTRSVILDMYQPVNEHGLRYAPKRTNPYVEADMDKLEIIARGDTESLPFEMKPSTSKLAVEGLRRTALVEPTNADQSVEVERARRQLTHINLPISPSQD